MNTTHNLQTFWCRSLYFLAICLGLALSARAAVIDTFLDGAVVNVSTTTFQTLSQDNLAGVIGSGERDLFWRRDAGAGVVSLDLNNQVAGNARLSSGAATVGLWEFAYGFNQPFDIDLTEGGQSDAFLVQFAATDPGLLIINIVDTDDFVPIDASMAIPSLPGGGVLAVPFALWDPTINFTHVAKVLIDIQGVAGGNYELQVFSTQLVPEPTSALLAAVALVGLLASQRR